METAGCRLRRRGLALCTGRAADDDSDSRSRCDDYRYASRYSNSGGEASCKAERRGGCRTDAGRTAATFHTPQTPGEADGQAEDNTLDQAAGDI